MMRKILSLALLVILDGIRCHALIGLILFAIALELGGLLFFEFIPRDIGRASTDFILSIGWLTGFLFLLFHAVQVMAWDEERRTIHTLLARPISRTQYVFGMFVGLAALILLLNIVLGLLGLGILIAIKNSVASIYFEHLSTVNYFLSWTGLFGIELIVLAVIALFSGLVRGGFPVLLLSVSYYFICSGLPVVRSVLQTKTIEDKSQLQSILQGMTFLFPDLSRFDLKELVIEGNSTPVFHFLLVDMSFLVFYVMTVLYCASLVYEKRDLQ